LAIPHPSRPPSSRAERNFGLLVGGVLLLLAAWWYLRGRFPSAVPVAVAVGALLVLFGLVAPRALYWPNRGWMALAEALSFVSTRVVLAVVFFIAVTPIGLVKRLTGWDPLRRRAQSAGSYWRPYPQRDPRHYEKMY